MMGREIQGYLAEEILPIAYLIEITEGDFSAFKDK